MSFVFYAQLEQSCPNVSHCPHLGGAAIGALESPNHGDTAFGWV